MARLEVLIPELLELNSSPDQDSVPFKLLIRRFETARRRAAWMGEGDPSVLMQLLRDGSCLMGA